MNTRQNGLYVGMSDPSQRVPRTVREAERQITIRVAQFHARRNAEPLVVPRPGIMRRTFLVALLAAAGALLTCADEAAESAQDPAVDAAPQTEMHSPAPIAPAPHAPSFP